jgi:hypothetical protein
MSEGISRTLRVFPENDLSGNIAASMVRSFVLLAKEHFDLPAATIQISHTAGAPREIVGQKFHLALLAVDLHQSSHPAQRFGIIGARVFVFEHHKLVAQDALIRYAGLAGKFRNQMRSNQIAKLSQNSEFEAVGCISFFPPLSSDRVKEPFQPLFLCFN